MKKSIIIDDYLILFLPGTDFILRSYMLNHNHVEFSLDYFRSVRLFAHSSSLTRRFQPV